MYFSYLTGESMTMYFSYPWVYQRVLEYLPLVLRIGTRPHPAPRAGYLSSIPTVGIPVGPFDIPEGMKFLMWVRGGDKGG